LAACSHKGFQRNTLALTRTSRSRERRGGVAVECIDREREGQGSGRRGAGELSASLPRDADS
jgi:hypothetical protein